MPNSVFIISGCRTPIGSFQDQFHRIPAVELGSIVIREALKRANVAPDDADLTIMGQILTAGQGQNTARQAAIGADIPYSTPAFTVNMVCGSGLKAVCLAYQAIRNKDNEIVIAGGQENMSRAQHASFIRGHKLGALPLNDTMVIDGLTDTVNNVHMGKTAEHLAKLYKIPREVQDEFAFESQKKASSAIENGYFKNEIIGVLEKKSGKIIETDGFVKPETTLEGLAKLRAAFETNGTVTAGNSSGLNDGAAALLLSSETQVKARKLKALARIIGFAEVGLDPMCMGLGPIDAVKKLLLKINWKIEDVDLFELNEAFAVQSVIVIDELGVDKSKVNVAGGGVALGHPIGASGARILVTLIYNLQRLNKKKGVAALCIGGGMGIAIAIETC